MTAHYSFIFPSQSALLNLKIFVLSLLCLVFFSTSESYSQKSNTEVTVDELAEMSFEDFIKVKVITASKKLQNIDEAPSTVRIITSRQIYERGYLTLEEALGDLPGFQFRNILGFNSYVFQRGIPSQNNLILLMVDGIQINELNSGGFYGGGQYNLSNVERIEVVYGPASALYGTNAVSGIVNIITKHPKDSQGIQADALYGSFGTLNSHVSYGYYDDDRDLGISISGMVYQSEKADLGGAEGDNNWSEDMENFENDVSFDAKLVYEYFTCGLTFQDKHASRTTNYKSVGSDYLDTGTDWHIRFINGYVKHDFHYSDKLSSLSQAYYRDATVMDNTIGYISNTSQAGYYRPNDLIGFESMVNYTPLEQLNLISGIVVESENLAESFSTTSSGSPATEPPTPPKPDMENNILQSLYLQTQYTFMKHLQLNAGVRFDNSSYYDQVYTPRIGLIFNRDDITGKLLYTEAFRAPKPWDYYYGVGNNDLEPEEMRSLEAVLGYRFHDDLRVEVSLYRNEITDLLTNSPLLSYWFNYGTVETDGFELALDYRRDKFTSYINYTYNNSTDQDGNRIPEISDHCLNTGAEYYFTKKHLLYLSGSYISARNTHSTIPATGDNIIDPAFVINTVFTYKYSAVIDFQLMVKNLLDAEYYHSSNRPPARYRQPQRTILFRLYWNFAKN